MFDAPYCFACGEKEHKNGYGCNNPKCKEYYKLKESLEVKNMNYIKSYFIIKKAKEEYPASYSFTGCLTEEQKNKIEKECDIRTLSVYMNGTTAYWTTAYMIRYRNEARP